MLFNLAAKLLNFYLIIEYFTEIFTLFIYYSHQIIGDSTDKYCQAYLHMYDVITIKNVEIIWIYRLNFVSLHHRMNITNK